METRLIAICLFLALLTFQLKATTWTAEGHIEFSSPSELDTLTVHGFSEGTAEMVSAEDINKALKIRGRLYTGTISQSQGSPLDECINSVLLTTVGQKFSKHCDTYKLNAPCTWYFHLDSRSWIEQPVTLLKGSWYGGERGECQSQQN